MSREELNMRGSDVVQVVGRRVLTFTSHAAGALALFGSAFRGLPALAQRPVRVVFYRQIYFTGVQGLFVVAAIALILGLGIITQVCPPSPEGLQGLLVQSVQNLRAVQG